MRSATARRDGPARETKTARRSTNGPVSAPEGFTAARQAEASGAASDAAGLCGDGGGRGRQRRRTVVVTATIDGCRGVELKPKRTGGSTSASGPRSTPPHVAAIVVRRCRSVAA